MQAHQPPVGLLMQWGEDEPAIDRFNGRHKLSCFELELGEPVEDLVDAQVPVLALEAHPVVESRGIAQREALQELTTRETDRLLELAKQAVMHVLWHGQRRASRGTREPPGLMEGTQVEFDIGGEIKTEGIACDEEVRRSITQQMTEMEQGNAQG